MSGRAHRLVAITMTGCLMVACTASRSYVILVTATRPGPDDSGSAAPALDVSATEPAPTLTFIPTPNPTRTAFVDPLQDQLYVVQPGDTVGDIAFRFGVSADSIVVANDLPDTNSLSAGQTLTIPTTIQITGPAFKIIPDSEFVYGPTVSGFDTNAFLAGRDCFLCRYREELDGRLWTGAEIIERVAIEQSINPRLLLAVLEYNSAWVSETMVSEEAALYPMGYVDRPTEIYSLYRQLDWAGKIMATGYYGWRLRGLSATLLGDGTRAGLDPTLNAGTVAVQVLLSQTRNLDGWLRATQYEGFFSTYVTLFGDPFQSAVEPILPSDLAQPALGLPWADGEIWYFTGGPHGGWGSGSAWASLDFVPDGEIRGCEEKEQWARAVADGIIARSEFGMIILDLDGDGFEGTGWTIVYFHMSSIDRAVTKGQTVSRGDALAHPSCEGGVSTGTHLHIGRRYNGEWIAADCSGCMLTGPAPQLNFDGWVATSFDREYDGSLTKGDEYREACTCREALNTLINPLP